MLMPVLRIGEACEKGEEVMNYEMAKKAAMRGETVRRMDWGIRGVYIDGAIWHFREAPQAPCSVTPLDQAATDWVIVRKRPRDVFTHPRRGDVIEGAFGGLIDILAVAPEGVLYVQRGAGINSTSRDSFKRFPTSGWTVKTRAPKKGKKS